MPPPTPCGGHPAGPHASRLRGMLVGALGEPSVEPNKLVLLRRAGSRRSITNHEAVHQALQSRGWRVTVHTGNEVSNSTPLVTPLVSILCDSTATSRMRAIAPLSCPGEGPLTYP